MTDESEAELRQIASDVNKLLIASGVDDAGAAAILLGLTGALVGLAASDPLDLELGISLHMRTLDDAARMCYTARMLTN